MRTRVVQADQNPSSRHQRDATPAIGAAATKRRGRVVSVIHRHPLSSFFVIAFALTWCTVPFHSFMAAGPLLAALIVLGVTEGRAGIRALGRRMVQWRVGWPYYVAALLVPISVGLAAGAGNLAFGASDAAFAELEVSAMLLLFGLRMVVPVFAPLGEEPGWRGFALPRMLRDRTPFAASLVLGLIVAAWHVPLLWVSEEPFEPVLLLGTVAVTFWYTWLFNRTGGSVFMTMVAHAADGLIGATLLGDGGWHGNAANRFQLLYTAAWILVAVMLVIVDRRRWFTRVTDPALVEGEPTPARRPNLIARGVAVTMVATVGVIAGAGVAGAQTSAHDAYVRRADAVCRRTVVKTDAVVEDLGFSPSDSDARVAGRKVVALARAELRKLRALPTPPKDAAEVAAIYRAMEQGWNRVSEKPSRLFDEPGPLAPARRLASKYGFEVCGKS